MKKRLLALILALAMCFSLALAVSADESGGSEITPLTFSYSIDPSLSRTDVEITVYDYMNETGIVEIDDALIAKYKPYYIITDEAGNIINRVDIKTPTFSLALTDPGKYYLSICDSTGKPQGRPVIGDNGNVIFEVKPIEINVSAPLDDEEYVDDHPFILDVDYTKRSSVDGMTAIIDFTFKRFDDPSLPIDTDFIDTYAPQVIVFDKFGRCLNVYDINSSTMSITVPGPGFLLVDVVDNDGYGQFSEKSLPIEFGIKVDNYKADPALTEKWANELLEKNGDFNAVDEENQYIVALFKIADFANELDTDDTLTFDVNLYAAIEKAMEKADYDETKLGIVYMIYSNWYMVDEAYEIYLIDKEGISEEPEPEPIPEITFTDVADDAWYADYVSMVAEAGLVKGKADGIFAPDDNMTIAEAITLVSRFNAILHEEESDPADGKTGKNWYDPYVEYAKANNLPNEYSNYNALITREEFAHIFAALYKNNKQIYDEGEFTEINSVPDNSIPDVDMSHKYADDIYTLYKLGVLAGSDAARNFLPTSNIKRSEVAAILCRLAGEGRVEF